MRIQLIQSSPVWENPSQSLAELETILSSSPEVDLVVLPVSVVENMVGRKLGEFALTRKLPKHAVQKRGG